MATTDQTQLVKTTPSPSLKSNRGRRYLGRGSLYVLLILVSIVLFTPFILAFLGTFKSNAEILAWPPQFLPSEWLFENWGKLWNTDFGGLPRPEGVTSLALMTGLFVFFGTFLLTGLTTEEKGKGIPRAVGLPICLSIAILAGVGSALYLGWRFNAQTVLKWSVGISTTFFALLAVAILAMSKPDWRRVILAMLGSLIVGVLVTLLFEFLLVTAGGGRFFRWMFNIGLLSVIRAFTMVIFCSMAGYAFARLKFPGRDLIFSFMLLTMMIPGALTLVPAYVVIAKMKWVNTAYGLVIPGVVGAFGIFLLTQFLKSIPRDLEEAAFIDGASYFQIYKDVVLPLARPVLLTLFIISFQSMWNDFLTPLLYLNTADMWVLNVALSVFQQQYKAAWNLTLVGAMINAVIPLTLFFFFSRYYIEGVSYSGLKG